MKIKKKIIYYLIELLYLATVAAFLFYFKNTYAPNFSEYEKELFLIVLFGLIGLTVFFGPILNKVISFIYTFAFGFYLFSQSIYYVAFNQYYRIQFALSVLSEVAGVKSSVAEFVSFSDFIPFILLALINIVFIVLYFIYQRKVVNFFISLIYRFIALALFFPIRNNYEKFNSLIEETKSQEDAFQMNKTDYYIYDNIPTTVEFVDKFGLVTFAYRDYLSFNEVRNWDEYLPEVDAVLNNKIHEDNEMTGIFKGKNLVIIQGESFNHYAVDKDLTPTLYKMANEGINVNGFNTPLLVGSTSDTEIMANTSIIPDSEEFASCYSYFDNTYKTTLATIFNSIGYITDAYHNCYGDYYNRDIIFPTMLQYQHWRDCTDMGKVDALSDYEYGQSIPWMYFDSNDPYMLYWITYSGHQPYDLTSVGVSEEDVLKIKEKYPDLDDAYVSYYAKNMDLDKTIANYMTVLSWNGQLENTVFVLFGDHMCKGLELNGYESATDLYIYCAGYEGKTINKVSTALDLLPTIANLWDIDYDYNSILGSDIFDPNYDGYLFTMWGYYETNNYTYTSGYDVTDRNGNVIKDETILKKINDLVDLKRISKIIQKTDYFKYAD